VIEALRGREATRALDLGCGTGTNVIYLARQGWEATGIDYVAQAIEEAKKKAAEQGVRATFYQGNVTRLEQLPLEGPFDFLLDIGCFHSLTREDQAAYVQQVARLAAPGALYMLYAGLPRKSNTGVIGISPMEVAQLFTPSFKSEREEIGEDTGGGWIRAWYWFTRAAG
jgi:2-polyprenyl-3-methyl-5-hydroxy-6-metoxy-1,4-benzoquinol methylase